MAWPAVTSCLCGLPTAWLAPGAVPGQILVCHCSDCRAQAGALAVPFAALPRAALRLATPRLATFRASPLAERIFCSTCGAFVGMDYGEEHTVWLALGSLARLPDGWLVPGRDCQTFLEHRVVWGAAALAMEHREGWGLYRVDPCRPGGGATEQVEGGNIGSLLEAARAGGGGEGSG
jgi:hypothetical protein